MSVLSTRNHGGMGRRLFWTKESSSGGEITGHGGQEESRAVTKSRVDLCVCVCLFSGCAVVCMLMVTDISVRVWKCVGGVEWKRVEAMRCEGGWTWVEAVGGVRENGGTKGVLGGGGAVLERGVCGRSNTQN